MTRKILDGSHWRHTSALVRLLERFPRGSIYPKITVQRETALEVGNFIDEEYGREGVTTYYSIIPIDEESAVDSFLMYKINVTLVSGANRHSGSHWSGYFLGWPSAKEGVLSAIRSDMAAVLLKVDLARQKERASIATGFGHFMQLVDEYDLPKRPTQDEGSRGFTQDICTRVGVTLGFIRADCFGDAVLTEEFMEAYEMELEL